MNIKSDFEKIRKDLGFCPQFDLLWDNLTAYEHMYIFSQIKQIPKKNLNWEIDQKLKDVNLLTYKNAYVYTFSGGTPN